MEQASSSSVVKESKVVDDEEKARLAMAAGKLKVVRVKRKREQAPIENLWLEVSDPPSKRHEPDISSLSLSSESTSLPPAKLDTTTPSKLLFRRLETVSPSSKKTEASLYESVLQKVNERKHAYKNRKDQQGSQAKSKVQEKQEHLLAAAKDQHEALAKRARFEQVWKSRRDTAKASAEGAENDPMSELFHLYDVVRVDEESPDVLEKRKKAKREAELAQAAILRDYLPLLRDCLPEAAADLEKDLASQNVPTEIEDYVYDVYAMDEGFSDQEGGEDQFYPTVRIVETEDFDYGEPADSEYDSQDSNDENNPLNDYPDEDDFGDYGDEKSGSNDSDDDSGDFDPDASDNEEYDTVAHVHINEPGRTAWEGFLTGTKVAAAGGTTAIVDMPLNARPTAATNTILKEKEAKAEGSSVTVETCAHYLSFSAEDVPEGATVYKCALPLRPSKHRELLWKALKEGDVDMITTDHSPSTPDLKLLEEGDFLKAWGGISGIQFALTATWTHGSVRGITIEQLSKWWSTVPAKLTNLPHKVSLESGKDADIVVWDPEASFVIDSQYPVYFKNRVSPYLGHKYSGKVITTIARGRQVFEGRHAERACGAPILHLGDLRSPSVQTL